jgi:hypothetical protein
MQGQDVTYYEHVAPIIMNNCVECHKRGDVAPFPLETYKDVSNKARLVQYVTETKYMPPWIADPSYRHYQNERLLSDKEIQTIKDWVKQGKKAGNKANAPKRPEFTGNSLMGRKPDLIIDMPEPYKIPGNNEETFVAIKFPGKLDKPMPVECIEFVPGNRKLVHHVNYFVMQIEEGIDYFKPPYLADPYGDAVHQTLYKLNMQRSDKKASMLFYAGWVPGLSPQVFTGNLGVTLPKRFVILANTIHYSFSPVEEYDDSKFYIYFKKDEIRRPVKLMNLGSGGGLTKVRPELKLDPGRIQRFKTHYKIKQNMSIIYAMPHMHMFGKSYLAYAVTPSGETIPLVRINKWDFNWQEGYRFDPMLYLPAGTTIYVEGVFDNTAKNPNQPFNPPRTIVSEGNMGTLNEMLNIVLLYTRYEFGDEKKKLLE